MLKYVLYGLPCSGKTTLMNELSIPVIHGSKILNDMLSGSFSQLSNDEKNKLRIEYTQMLSCRSDTFISDGHYSFLDDVVFTQNDGDLYDVFLYLYCEPKVILKRFQVSSKNSRFAYLSEESIYKWQNYEIESLRSECHARCKDFYVVRDISSDELQFFICKINKGYSSYSIAVGIADKIMRNYPTPCEVHICDGDKTIITQDSFRLCTDNYVTNIFDGGFYTGYQSFAFSKETAGLDYNVNKLSDICINDTVYDMVRDKNYVILSSGITSLWERIASRLGLKNVVADTNISADTKYFVVRILQDNGYSVTAYGDGRNDYYMLKQADTGYLYIGSYLSRSLRKTDLSGISLLYDKSPFILSEVDDTLFDDIAICKSGSGINGSKLADAHNRLGKKLGEVMNTFIPSTGTAVIVLERGGRFFGDGIYTGFGGTFYAYNPKKDKLPKIQNSAAVIVDSVINTGNSVLATIEKIKEDNPDIDIVIAVNVIQEKAFKVLNEYKVFAIRTSQNSFVGNRQAVQKDGKGPDTADRLYNYIR